jgi:hypothetical protein
LNWSQDSSRFENRSGESSAGVSGVAVTASTVSLYGA